MSDQAPNNVPEAGSDPETAAAPVRGGVPPPQAEPVPARWLQDEEDEISLLGLANVLLKQWRLVAGLPIAAAAVAVVVSLLIPPKFTATATFKALAAKAVPAAATDATETIFADVIANGDNLVRVWRFSNADQSWAFYDPRPAFITANTLTKSGAGDIVWVNVITEQEFQGGTLFPGWNLISLK